MKVAIPCENKAELDSARSIYFHNCDYYALFDIEDGEVKGYEITNRTDAAGQFDAIVLSAADRPTLALFADMGVEVHIERLYTRIGDAADAFATGRTTVMHLKTDAA